MKTIGERIGEVRGQIAAAAQQAGRSPAEISLIAVTKTHAPEMIRAAISAGAHDLGENRVQEAASKVAALADTRPQLRWHLLGHLQRNKARQAVELFDLIHSVDSLRLADTLSRHARERTAHPGAPISVLLQVNVSGEASKEGFDLPGGLANQVGFDALLPELEAILALPGLAVRGLMTIAPIVAAPEAARPVFARLRELRDELARRYPQAGWDVLSMGMSDDFAVAIAEGATSVRVGRAIFGER